MTFLNEKPSAFLLTFAIINQSYTTVFSKHEKECNLIIISNNSLFYQLNINRLYKKNHIKQNIDMNNSNLKKDFTHIKGDLHHTDI